MHHRTIRRRACLVTDEPRQRLKQSLSRNLANRIKQKWEGLVIHRNKDEKVGVTFVPIVNYSIDWTI
jgi:hypothetical protein